MSKRFQTHEQVANDLFRRLLRARRPEVKNIQLLSREYSNEWQTVMIELNTTNSPSIAAYFTHSSPFVEIRHITHSRYGETKGVPKKEAYNEIIKRIERLNKKNS